MTGNPRWQIGDRAVWVHDIPGAGRQPRRTVRTLGTVTAIDLPRVGSGIRLALDELVNGIDECYATYGEIDSLRPEDGEQ